MEATFIGIKPLVVVLTTLRQVGLQTTIPLNETCIVTLLLYKLTGNLEGAFPLLVFLSGLETGLELGDFLEGLKSLILDFKLFAML